MADDPKILAASMINMYGEGAEDMARRYAKKHKDSSDKENHALWLQIAEYIATRRNKLKE